MSIFLLSMLWFLSILIYVLFYVVSLKFFWDSKLMSSFECGYTSYFSTRFSFSVHYFVIGLIFLFLDLELCLLMPFFNESMSSFFFSNVFLFIVIILLLGLLEEWREGKLDWENWAK